MLTAKQVNDELLDAGEVARIYKVDRKSLTTRLRHTPGFPPCVKLPGRPKWRASDIAAHLESLVTNE